MVMVERSHRTQLTKKSKGLADNLMLALFSLCNVRRSGENTSHPMDLQVLYQYHENQYRRNIAAKSLE